MTSLGNMLDSFSPVAITVTRRPAGTYVKGIFTPGTSLNVQVEAVIVPLRGRELGVLPEGLRSQRTVQLFSKAELRTAKEGSNDADRFTHGGDTFEVALVEDWTTHGGFYRAVATKVDPS